MKRVLTALLLLVTVPVLADEPTAPPVMPTETTGPAVHPKFLDLALKVDGKNQITEGRSETPVSHRELFRRLGRTDLVTQSEDMQLRRTWFIVSAATLGVVAVAAGTVLILTAPKLNSIACESDVRIYNDVCVPRAAQHNWAGSATIVTGVLGAALLATLAYWSDPSILDRDQTSALVSSFNSQLARTLRQAPSGLKVLPVVSPDGAFVAASARF